MEEERLIPTQEKKFDGRPNSFAADSSCDCESSTSSRPTTTNGHLVNTSCELTYELQGECSSSQSGHESSHKRTHKKLCKGEMSMIGAVRTNGANVGWTETRTAHIPDDDDAQPKYTDIAVHDANPPQYCKR